MPNETLILKAPVSGQIYPLERVPDPVFSQKLVGDGISIDPTDSVLRAPGPGEVMHLHAASHALTLRLAHGVEVLMHIGIDTVSLQGQGFTPRVKIGDKVATGDPLIEFDIDQIATKAKSLLTQVVISNGETVRAMERASGMVKAGSDTLITLSLADGAATGVTAEGATVTSEAILVPNETGLHARPAAVLASVAKGFQSEVKLQSGDRTANARSVTSIMALDIRHGDKVMVVAKGPDASDAVKKLSKLIGEGLGDEGRAPAPAPASTTIEKIAEPVRSRSSDPNILLGVAASPGLAVGKVFQVQRAEIVVEEEGHGVERERKLLAEAIDKARAQLEALRAQLHATADPAKAAIFAAHAELLNDPDFLEIANSAMAKGKSAAFGWKSATELHAQRLASLRNELLAQRANDVRDVGGRVLQLLTGVKHQPPAYPRGSVLIAEDLTPSDTATMERGVVVGFATVRGGATSHVAILARSLQIPAIAGIEPRALEVAQGTAVVLDGGKGSLRLNPSPDEMDRIRNRQERLSSQRKEDMSHAEEPAMTSDGKRVHVFANIGGLKDAEQVLEVGGEGVGLLRSEFLFMDRPYAPNEDEQTESYAAILRAVGPQLPVIFRTLDVGGDKPLPYLPIPHEDNPFLGERGIRVGLDRPEVLRTQLRALLRASPAGRALVMFPMVATMQELRDAKTVLAAEAKALGVPPIPCGIMVEVPAVAVMAETFAAEADFFSVGTNDLTQYTLAMDRGHAKLAPKVDALNPAVLNLIAQTIDGAHKHDRLAGICGGVAGDPHAVPILIGLGIDELSVSLAAIPTVKAQIRRLSLAVCRDLAKQALTCATAEEVRALIPEPES